MLPLIWKGSWALICVGDTKTMGSTTPLTVRQESARTVGRGTSVLARVIGTQLLAEEADQSSGSDRFGEVSRVDQPIEHGGCRRRIVIPREHGESGSGQSDNRGAVRQRSQRAPERIFGIANQRRFHHDRGQRRSAIGRPSGSG